jgi:histidinol-phosphate aminotransferase
MPSKESILVTPPTFGLYKARAMLNDVGTVECPLKQDNGDFILDVPQVLESLAASPQIKLAFLASPGNPTGSLISLNDLRTILSFEAFKGIVVVDEAYIDFCPEASSASAINLMSEFANLLVLQSMSKTLGLAGLRLGMAFGHPSVIQQLHKIQMPYFVSTPTAMIAIRALSSAYDEQRVKSLASLISNREKLIADLATLRKASGHGLGTPLGMSQANFIVLPLLEPGEQRRQNARAKLVTKRLKSEHSISVRYIGDLYGCEGCIRITVGTEWENEMFVNALGVVLESC